MPPKLVGYRTCAADTHEDSIDAELQVRTVSFLRLLGRVASD